MPVVQLKPIFPWKEEHLGIFYPNDKEFDYRVRKIKGIKWSEKDKCWYLPLARDSYKKICDCLSDVDIDISQLKQYLDKRKKIVATGTSASNYSRAVVKSKTWKLSPQNLEAMRIFIEQLKLRAYSQSTIRTYRSEFFQFLFVLKKKCVDDLAPDDLKRYMVYAMEQQGISENTARSRINAIKFYFEKVLGREKFFHEIPSPKRPFQLPKLLNETELSMLFNALKNKKHKAMLFTVYSSGLRVSEVVNLKLADIDSRRMQILVRSGKGKKDRYVNLSPVLLDILRKYISTYTPRPQEYLFESEQTGPAYPTRTVQQIFTNAKNAAGIRKEVGIHSLRHSFATHLLDKGTDIRYIKDLLGHFNIKTTERYLHVSKKQLVNIVSPFDDLWKNEKLEW